MFKVCFHFALTVVSGSLAFSPNQLRSRNQYISSERRLNGLKSHEKEDSVPNQISTNEESKLAELHQRSLLAARLSFESRGWTNLESTEGEETTGETESISNIITQESSNDSIAMEKQQQSLLSTRLAMKAIEVEKQLVQEQEKDPMPVKDSVEAYALYEEWLKNQSSPKMDSTTPTMTPEEASETNTMEDISSGQTSEDIMKAMNPNESNHDSQLSIELKEDVPSSLEAAWPNVDRTSIQKSKKERVAKIDQFLNKARSLREAMLAEANSLKDQTAMKEKDLKLEYGTAWTPSITLKDTKNIDNSLEKAKALRDAMLSQAIALKEKTRKEEERIQKIKENASREAEELARAALANAKAKEEARAKALAEAEAKAKEEAEAKLRAEIANAKAKEEAKAKAKLEAEAKEKEEAEAKRRAEMAREKAKEIARAAEEAEAKARESAEAEAKAREIAEAEAKARAIMEGKQRAQQEAEAKAQELAEAEAKTRELAEAELTSEVEIEVDATSEPRAELSHLSSKTNDAASVNVEESLTDQDLHVTDEIRLLEIEQKLLSEMTVSGAAEEDTAYLLHQQWLREEEGVDEKEESKDKGVEDDVKTKVRLLAKEKLESEKRQIEEETARRAEEQNVKDEEEKRKKEEVKKAQIIEKERLQAEEKARLIAWDQESNMPKKRFSSKEDEWAQWIADEPNNNQSQQKKKTEPKPKSGVKISWMGGNNAFDVDWTETLNVGSSTQSIRDDSEDEPARNESISSNQMIDDESIIMGSTDVVEGQHENELIEEKDLETPTKSSSTDLNTIGSTDLIMDENVTKEENNSPSYENKEIKKGLDEIIDMVGSVVVQRHLYRFSPTEGAFRSPFVFEDRQLFKVKADKSLSRFGDRSFILRQIAPSKTKNKYSVQLGPAILGIDGLKDNIEPQEESRELSWQTAYAAALYCMVHPRLMAGKGLGLSSGVGNVGILSILGTAFVHPGLSVMEGDFSSLVPIPKRLSKFVMTDENESNILKCIENLEASSFPSNRVNLGVYDLSQKVPRDMRNSFDFILSSATSNFNGLARTMAFALKPAKSDFMTKERTQGQFVHINRGTRQAVDDLLRTLQSDYKMKFRVDNILLEKLNLTPLVFSSEEEAETNFREEVESSTTSDDVRIEHVEALPYTSTSGYHDEGYNGDNGEYFFPGGGFL